MTFGPHWWLYTVSTPVMYSDGKVPAYGGGDRTNPWVLATQTGYNEFWENKIQTNVTLEQKLNFITKGLRFIGRFGYDTNNETTNNRVKWPEQWKAERHRDSKGQLVMNRIAEESLLTMASSSNGERLENLEAELGYERTFGGKHQVGGTLKYSQNQKNFTVGIGSDMAKGIAYRNQGLAGRATYSYAYKYFVDFNFGYTGTEKSSPRTSIRFFPSCFRWLEYCRRKMGKKTPEMVGNVQNPLFLR